MTKRRHFFSPEQCDAPIRREVANTCGCKYSLQMQFSKRNEKAYRKSCEPGRVITIPPGCTANAPQFTINIASIDVSAQLDSIYVSHDDFNDKVFLGQDFDDQTEGKPDFFDDVRAFLRNHSDLNHRAVNLRTVADIAKFHEHLRETEMKSPWKFPSFMEVLQQGAASVLAVVIFAFIVWLIFKGLSCFWKSQTGLTVRALRPQCGRYPDLCGGCTRASNGLGMGGTFLHMHWQNLSRNGTT